MPFLLLSHEEAMLFSTACTKEPNKISPLVKNYVQTEFEFRKDLINKSIPKFLDKQMLLLDKDENLHLSRQLEPVFYILNNPSEVITFMVKRSPDFIMQHFARVGDTWIMDATTIDEKVEMIGYPLDKNILKQYFTENILPEYKFDDALSAQLPEVELSLTENAIIVLSVMQEVYKSRIDKINTTISGDHLWIGRDEIISAGNTGDYKDNFVKIISIDKIKGILADDYTFKQTIDELKHFQLIEESEGKYCYSGLSKLIFDPVKIQDGIMFTQVFNNSKVIVNRTMNIMTCGYFMTEADLNLNKIRIRTIKPGIDKAFLFDYFYMGLNCQPVGIEKAQETAPPKVETESEFYFVVNGQQSGPLGVSKLIDQGVTAETLVWKDGMAEWKKAEEVDELKDLFKKAAPPPIPGGPPPPPPPPSGSMPPPPPKM